MVKCPHFNVGYCKYKDECTLDHPTSECNNECNDRKCSKRHRRKCMNGDECTYYPDNKCEFRHDSTDQTRKETNHSEIKELNERIDASNSENVKKDEIIHNLELELRKKENMIDTIDKNNTMYYNELKNEHEKHKRQSEIKYDKLLQTHNKCIKRIEKLEQTNKENKIDSLTNEQTHKRKLDNEIIIKHTFKHALKKEFINIQTENIL